MPRKKKNRPQIGRGQLPGKFSGKTRELKPKDKGSGGFLGTGIGPDVGPDIASGVADVAGGFKEHAADIGQAALRLNPSYAGAEAGAEGKSGQNIMPGNTQIQYAQELGKAASASDVGAGARDAWNNTFGRAVNPTARWAFTGLQAPEQFVQGRLRNIVSGDSAQTLGGTLLGGPASAVENIVGLATPEGREKERKDVTQAVEQTTLAQAAGRKLSGEDSGLGEGLLPSPDSPAGKAQAAKAREFSPYLIGGHAWTPGRALATVVGEPGDAAYDNLSGVTDAIVTTGTDPVLYTGGAVARARKGAKTIVPAEAGAEVERALTGPGKKVAQQFFDATNADEIQKLEPALSRETAEAVANQTTREGKLGVLKGEIPVSREFTPQAQPVAPLERAPNQTDIQNALRGELPEPKLVPELGPQTPLVSEKGITLGEREALIQRAGGHLGVRRFVDPLGVEETMSRRGFGRVRNKILKVDGEPAEVRQILGRDFAKQETEHFYPAIEEAVQKVKNGADPHVIDDVFYPVLGVGESKMPTTGLGYQLRRATKNVRIAGMTPGDYLNWRDPADTIEQLDRFGRNAKVSWEERKQVINDYMRNPNSRANRYATVDAAMDMTERALVNHGMDPKLANKWTRWARQGEEDARQYAVNQIANADGPVYFKGVVGPDGEPLNFAENPHSLNELLNEKVPLPDFRQIRRNTSFMKPFFANNIMEAGTAGGDYFMNVWKLGKLFRPALAVRVVGEEQLRMAATGELVSVANNPVAAIAWAAGTPDSTMARVIDKFHNRFGGSGGVPEGAGLTPGEADNLATEGAGLPQGGGRSKLAAWFEKRHSQRARGMVDVTGGRFAESFPGETDWFGKAVNQRMNALYGDTRHHIYRREFTVVDRAHETAPRGLVEDISRVSDPLHRQAARGVNPNELRESFWSGDLKRQRLDMAQDELFAPLATDRAWSDAYVDSAFQRVDMMTGGDARLKQAFATGNLEGEALRHGGIVTNPKAVEKMKGILDEGVGPERIKVQRMDTLPVSERAASLQKAKGAVDTLFSYMMPKETAYLSRSPTFRQAYWNESERLLPYLKEEDRAKFLQSADEAHLGERRLAGMRNKQSVVGPDDARAMDLNQLDTAAKSHGLDYTKNLLYDLSERSQVFDVLRLVFPFGEAWKEVIGRWAKLTWNDPSILRKGQLAVEGARDANFFSKDLEGNEVFNIPGTEWLTDKMVGIPTPMTASVSGLNIVSSGLPGVGPVAQIPMSHLMKNNPDLEFLRDFVFPYGEPQGTGEIGLDIVQAADPSPSWLRRLRAAASDPTQVRMLGSATAAMMKYNLSTGKYDIHGPDALAEQKRLVEDSTEQGRKLLATQAAVQLFSPSAPQADYQVKDKDGKNVSTSKLADEWRNLTENESLSYEDAYKQFIKKHGEGNLLITQSMTEPVAGFMPLTDEGSRWALRNQELRADYPDVYGLFAPSEGKFSMQEYQRQLDMGERATIPADEMLRRANGRSASVIYHNQRDKIGKQGNTEAGRRYLSDLKDWLSEQYPGYKPDEFNPGENPNLIRQLETATRDKRVNAASPRIAGAISEYLDQRAQVIKGAEGGNLKGKADEPRRRYLRDYGSYLSRSVPGFSRVYSYVFDNELAS